MDPDWMDEAEDDNVSESPESEEYSPGREQAMIDSIYFNPEIPRGSPEIGLPTTPVLRSKTTEKLVAREPGEQTVSTDSHVYDPIMSPTPQPRRVEIPESSPFNTDYASFPSSPCSKDCDYADDEPETVGADPEDPEALFRPRRPEWYHPHTNMSNQYFENNKNPPQLLEDYEHWRKETMTVVLIAGFKEFANGNLDHHRDSIFFRAGDRKAFGIITRAMERGIPGLEEAVEKHVRDGNSSPWPMRDWVIAGRCARDPKGKRGLLPAEIAITSPDAFNMTSKELLLALDVVGKGGLNTPESISPGPALSAPGPSTLPPASSVPHLASYALGTSTLATASAPEPASTSNVSGPSTLPSASSAPGTASDAPGPATLATTSAPDPASNAPLPSTLTTASNPGAALNAPEPFTIPPDSARASSAPPPASHPGPPSDDPTEQWYNRRDRYIEELDPEEVFAQWRRFFSSSLSDNGGCVEDFAKHLDQQCYDLEIFRNHSEIPIWVKKMQLLHGLPGEFAHAKAKFLRKHGRRLFRQDPERDGQGRVMEGNARAVTWDYLVEEMEKEEARQEGKRMEATETMGYEPVGRYLRGEGGNPEEQLMRESAESEEKAKKGVQDSKTICPIFKEMLRDRFHVAAEGAACHASNAPPTRQEKVPSPSNLPNAPLRTPFYQFTSSRKRADPRKDALPSRSSLKQPARPTASGSSAAAAADATVPPPESDKSKGKSTPTEKAKSTKSTKPNPPDASSSKTAPAQSSPSAKKDSHSNLPSSSAAKAIDPPRASEDNIKPELPRTPVKRPRSVPHRVSDTKNTTSKQPGTTGSKVIKSEPLNVPSQETIEPAAPVTSNSEVLKHEAPIKSDSKAERKMIPCTPPRKTIIDPRRIDVDPDTLPDYCNTCRKSGHADRTQACPRYDPISGVIVGRDVGRALLPGKTEQERLLKERDEVLAREKHAAEKAERKRARAEMKEREKSERQRRKGVAGEEKGQVEVSVPEKQNAPQAMAQGDGEPATSANAPNATAQVERQKKKSKEKKAKSAVRIIATAPVGARSDVGDRNQLHAAPKTKNGLPVALPSQPEPTAIAGTKRKSDEVDEAADAIVAESKRRRQEKRRVRRERAKEKKQRPLEFSVGE